VGEELGQGVEDVLVKLVADWAPRHCRLLPGLSVRLGAPLIGSNVECLKRIPRRPRMSNEFLAQRGLAGGAGGGGGGGGG
jgi:hypothetical protein